MMRNEQEKTCEISSANKAKILKIEEFFLLKTLRGCIYPANKCSNANNSWHFVKMPTIVGTLTFISMINFMLC